MSLPTQSAMAVPQAKQASAIEKRAKVYKEMNGTLQSEAKELQQALNDRQTTSLQWYLAIGKRCSQLRDKREKFLTQEQLSEGVDPLTLVCAYLSTSADTLRKAMQFYRVYGTEGVKRLTSYRNPADPTYRLTFSHAVHLMSLDTDKQRERIERMASDGLLTQKQVAAEVKLAMGGSRNPNAGRPIVPPKSISAQLAQIFVITSQVLTKSDKIWNGPDHNVFTNVMNVPPDRYTPTTVDALEKIAELQRATAAKLTEDLALCERTLEHVRAALASHPSPAIVDGAAAPLLLPAPKVPTKETKAEAPAAAAAAPTEAKAPKAAKQLTKPKKAPGKAAKKAAKAPAKKAPVKAAKASPVPAGAATNGHAKAKPSAAERAREISQSVASRRK